jgi:hypothetical protein
MPLSNYSGSDKRILASTEISKVKPIDPKWT